MLYIFTLLILKIHKYSSLDFPMCYNFLNVEFGFKSLTGKLLRKS